MSKQFLRETKSKALKGMDIIARALKLDQVFVLCVLFFACNTGVCLQLYIDIALGDITGFRGKLAQKAYPVSCRGISQLKLFIH